MNIVLFLIARDHVHIGNNGLLTVVLTVREHYAVKGGEKP